MLSLVISGGQDGADLAGLEAAQACGIPTGGAMPLGFRTLSGRMPEEDVERFGMTEMSVRGYQVRTRRNVVTADATIRLAHNWASPGERLTKRLCEELGRPMWDVTLARNNKGEWSVEGRGHDFCLAYAQVTANWLRDEEIEVLNVAGNGDRTIEPFVEWFLMLVFTKVNKP